MDKNICFWETVHEWTKEKAQWKILGADSKDSERKYRVFLNSNEHVFVCTWVKISLVLCRYNQEFHCCALGKPAFISILITKRNIGCTGLCLILEVTERGLPCLNETNT